jgi:hypothetical protein
MKAGRNDPCPCGSGKKYKKCCLAADEAKLPAVIEPPNLNRADAAPPEFAATPEPAWAPEPKPVDPEQAAIDQALKQRYEQFNVADIEGKVGMFLRLVDGQDDPPMDKEDAIEMLGTLEQALARTNQRPRFGELLEALRQKQPQVYEQSKLTCLELKIKNLVALERADECAEPAKELAALGGKDIDVLRRVMDMLDFHGRLPLLVEVVRIAWPEVRQSRNVVPWGIAEFVNRASLYEIYDYIEQHPDASGAEEELLLRLRNYREQDDEQEPTWVAKYLTHLNRPVPIAPPLNLAEFDLSRRKPKRRWRDEDDDDASSGDEDQHGPDDALVNLSVTFLGWMRREKGVSLTRGQVGRREMTQFFLDRAKGILDERRSMMQAMMEPDRKPRRRAIEHPLCPDRTRFEAYLARLLAMMSWRYFHAATLMHITPLWLEFLELNGLLTAQQRRDAMQSLSDLLEPLRGLLSRDVDDPPLIASLDTWFK